jgi:hypothetical protein
MWILPKSIISAFAPGTEALISDSDEFSPVAEQSLMWRSKPSQSRTWSQRWKRENWIKHLSGRTLKRSRQNNFTDWWTSSLEATRANRSVPPVNDSEPKTQDTSGRFCEEQFELFDQVESSLKTSKDTYRLDSPRYSAIWTKMVIEQRGEYLARRNAARATRENECSSMENWPTAAARDWKDSPGPWMYDAVNPDGTERNRTDQLARAVYHQQWPTPTARDHKDSGENVDYKKLAKKHKLAGAVQSWPTPTTAEAQKIPNVANYGQKGLSNHPAIRGLPDREKLRKSGKNPEQWPTPNTMDVLPPRPNEKLAEENRTRGGRKNRQALSNLREAVQSPKYQNWPTPKAGDPGSRKPGTGGKVLAEEAQKNPEQWATPRAASAMAATITENQVDRSTRRGNGNLEEQQHQSVGQKLNPNWVEQLMGVPAAWTQLPTHWLTEWTDFDSSETALSRIQQQKHGQS